MKNRQPLALIIAALSLVTLVGCGSNSDSDNSNSTYIADFENWGPDFQTIKLSFAFGKIERNDVKKFVKKGKYSAKVQPQGDPDFSEKPFFYFPLRSKEYEYDKSNLKNYLSYSFSFYNDGDEDIKVNSGFIAKVKTVYQVDFASGNEYTLKAHQWNDFTYDIDLSVLNMFFNIEEAPGIYFEFEKSPYKDISFVPNLYLDELYFTKSDGEQEIEDIFDLDENEICDFEKDFQKNFLRLNNVFNSHLSFDITSSNSDGDILPTSGNNMLHIHSNAGPGSRWVNWSHLVIDEQYMQKTDLANLPIKEVENQQWAFTYDFTVENIERESVVPTFFNTGRANEKYIGGLFADEKVWKHVEIIFNMPYQYLDTETTIGIGYVLNIGQFDFSIPDEPNEYDIYIDNIRLVKVAQEE